MVSAITLVAGLTATAMGLLTVGTMLYFAAIGIRRDSHSPPVE